MKMQALSYAQIEATAKDGPEAVAAMLFAAGVEISGLPSELRRKLRGEAPATLDPSTPLPSLDGLRRESGEDDAAYNARLREAGRARPPAKDPPPTPTAAKRTPSP